MINNFLFPSDCRQVDVYTSDEVQNWNSFLKENEDRMIIEFPSDRRELEKKLPALDKFRYSDVNDTYFPVNFDGSKVVSEEASQVFRDCKNLEPINDLVVLAISTMLRELNKPKGNYEVGISILQHHQFKETTGVDWHRDLSRYTMVVLLSNQGDWLGGEFLFRPKDSLFGYFPKTFTPQKGKGILFLNEGTEHKVSPFSARGLKADRTIFSIHLKN